MICDSGAGDSTSADVSCNFYHSAVSQPNDNSSTVEGRAFGDGLRAEDGMNRGWCYSKCTFVPHMKVALLSGARWAPQLHRSPASFKIQLADWSSSSFHPLPKYGGYTFDSGYRIAWGRNVVFRVDKVPS